MKSFYKGPITSCEYLDSSNLLIGYGPFLSLVDSTTLEEKQKIKALNYRVIHKIYVRQSEKLVIVFGQKAINILSYNDSLEFSTLLSGEQNLIELDDWIFDCFWLDQAKFDNIKDSSYLMIVCAHNQCVFLNLNQKCVEKTVYCDQKCML
jgi:hypothetical protein